MLNQQTEAFKDETAHKQQRLQFLQSRFPLVNVRSIDCVCVHECVTDIAVQKVKIDEQNSIVLTLEDDVTQLNDNLMYLKKEGW